MKTRHILGEPKPTKHATPTQTYEVVLEDFGQTKLHIRYYMHSRYFMFRSGA